LGSITTLDSTAEPMEGAKISLLQALSL
jgi:hypothetical protein